MWRVLRSSQWKKGTSRDNPGPWVFNAISYDNRGNKRFLGYAGLCNWIIWVIPGLNFIVATSRELNLLTSSSRGLSQPTGTCFVCNIIGKNMFGSSINLIIAKVGLVRSVFVPLIVHWYAISGIANYGKFLAILLRQMKCLWSSFLLQSKWFWKGFLCYVLECIMFLYILIYTKNTFNIFWLPSLWVHRTALSQMVW